MRACGIIYLFTESRKVYEVLSDRAINFELRYSGVRPLRDLKSLSLFGYHAEYKDYSNLNSGTVAMHLRHSLRKLDLALRDFGVFEVCLLVLCHSFPKQHCNSRNAAESRLCRYDAMLMGEQIA